MDLEKSSAPVPGWYADPEFPGSDRYWDGSAWSDQRRPSQAPGAGAPPSSNGFAITSLVCGIVGVVLVVVLIGALLGIVAIVFGVLARNRAAREPGGGRSGMATAGLVLGIVAVVLTIAYVVVAAIVVDTTVTFFDEVVNCFDHPDDPSCR